MNHRPRSPSSIETRPRRWARKTRTDHGRALVAALTLALAGATGPSVGASRVWLVAGEPDRQSATQRSEGTALWLADALRAAPGAPLVQTWLSNPAPETVDRAMAKAADTLTSASTPMQALARVFGQQTYEVAPSRRQRAAATLVGARADTVLAALDKEVAALRPNDRGLFFYAGPGVADPSDAAGNTLRLWDNTALSVQQLDTASRHAPVTAPMRFVLTQCHSSGFQRLVRPSARDLRQLGRQNRCVFTSAPVDHLTHHCMEVSADTESGPGAEQDYASLFFAALSGRPRAGAPLRRSPDLDGDRVVTLHEAHLHATTEGIGVELPRSSTETYLERWQPIWLRYLDTHSEPDNDYSRTAQALAERLRLPLKGRALVDALETRQTGLRERLERLDEESRRADVEIERLQTTLRRALVQRWPAAAHPYTTAHARFLANDLDAVHGFLLGQSATYPKLVARQERQAQIARDSLSIQRDLTQLDKLMRLRQLARLQVQFERHASPQARQELERLTRCEKTPL